MTPASMERNRKYNRDRRAAGLRESPTLRKKHNRKYRITSYGITEADFAKILEAQGNACGMCHEPFEDGQLIHIDHDHDCCKAKNRSCGKCVRGLRRSRQLTGSRTCVTPQVGVLFRIGVRAGG
jgi:Recombination endonuclease VII